MFACRYCKSLYPRWSSQCIRCTRWGTITESLTESLRNLHAAKPIETDETFDSDTERDIRRNELSSSSTPQPLHEVEDDATEHIPSGIGELDRVLGGGVVFGGTYLLGGDPGVGKSTLLLQMLSNFAREKIRCLYVSGEESAGQIAARAKRLGASPKKLLVYAASDLSTIEDTIYKERPQVIIVDSAQTMRSDEVDSEAGSILQIKKICEAAVEWSHELEAATFIIGHVTKDGSLAGPKTLQHLVDATLSFEGEKTHAFRTLRAHKNRFGTTQEVGIFEMGPKGMRGVANPSEVFLKDRVKGVAGSVTAAAAHGSRTMLVEVQALVTLLKGSGTRMTTGIDSSRLPMILSVLERVPGVGNLANASIFVNVVGGMRIEEPALDLPIALAIVSSLQNRAFKEELVAFGEVGLSGELRRAPRTEERFKEASSMKFKGALAPSIPEKKSKNFVVTEVRTLSQAIEAGLKDSPRVAQAKKRVVTKKRGK